MKKSLLERVYHPIDLWEEMRFNMWGSVSDRALWVQKAFEFTSDHVLYGRWMLKVTRDWPYSCENALTDRHLNQKAWIGHAACAYAIQCPEDIVREAWGKLDDEQQFLANGEAARAIASWTDAYQKARLVPRKVVGKVLS